MSAQLKELLFPNGKIHTGEPEGKLRPSLSNSCAAGMRPSSLHCVSRLRPRPPLQNGNNPCPTGVSACESLRAQPSSNVKTMTLFAQEQQLKFAGGFTVFRNVHGQFLCNTSPSENTLTSALQKIPRLQVSFTSLHTDRLTLRNVRDINVDGGARTGWALSLVQAHWGQPSVT